MPKLVDWDCLLRCLFEWRLGKDNQNDIPIWRSVDVSGPEKRLEDNKGLQQAICGIAGPIFFALTIPVPGSPIEKSLCVVFAHPGGKESS